MRNISVALIVIAYLAFLAFLAIKISPWCLLLPLLWSPSMK